MTILNNTMMRGITSGVSINRPQMMWPAQPTNGLDRLAKSLDNLADALTNLAKAIGGLKGGNPYTGTPQPMPMPTPFPGPVSGNPPSTGNPPVSEGPMAPIAGKGRIWGDPHFIGADGGKFDVQGKPGKVYNLLSDKGFQMNGRFDSWGNKGATVVGQVAIKLSASADNILVDKNGDVAVSGRALKDGETVTLEDGTKVTKRGKNVLVQSKEWKVDIETRGDHINMDVSTDNAVSDGVRPHGLLGQTFDGDGKARNGDKGAGAQGGGAIEGTNGEIIARGDKSSIEAYEVGSIFDSDFKNFNRDPYSNYSISQQDYLAPVQNMFMQMNLSLNYSMNQAQNVTYF